MKHELCRERLAIRVLIGTAFLAVGLTAGPPAGATIFIPTMGFEDDVDLIVDPDKQYVVIPEEKEDGSEGHLKIVDIDPTTGAPLAIVFEIDVIGFEDGVDPFIAKCSAGAEGMVVVPLENEDGSMAQILLLEVDPTTGAMETMEMIDLAFLGFRPDVDGTWTNNPTTPDDLGFFALESELGDERGVIAIDLSCDGDDPYGACVLLSSAGLPSCLEMESVDWLPGLTSAVDPFCFSDGPAFARFILPVSSADGNDLLLIDFDPNDAVDQPLYTTYTSVKAVNASSALPTPFPGFEEGVDMCELETMCMLWGKLLVPVEGPGDAGDLYVLNVDSGFDGEAVWVYSIDGDPDVPIPGYKEGVDLLPMCDLGGAAPNRVAVPVENEAGTDADLLIVNLETGELVAHAEDPVLNPGLTLPGYEIGIEPLRWDADHLVVPAEADGFARIYNFTVDGDLIAWAFSNSYGYVRSVDPVVVPVPAGMPPIFTPVAKPDGSDADVWISEPPFPAFSSLEEVNAAIPLTISGFEWDVDPGAVQGSVMYHHYMYLPEEDESGTEARVRFQEILSDVDEMKLVVATQEVGADPASLLFFHPDGELDRGFDDVLGLEPGLDMADRVGPLHAANPPAGLIAGQDADTDPTLLWLLESSSIDGEPMNQARAWRVEHANPFPPDGQLSFTLPATGETEVDVFDASGRRVRQLFHGPLDAGVHSVVWDGRDAGGQTLPSGTYFLRVRSSTAGAAVTKLVMLR